MVIKIAGLKIITTLGKVKYLLTGLKTTVTKEKIANFIALITLERKIVQK